MSGPSIFVSATFTADAIEPILAFWMRQLGLDYGVRIGPYHQVFQMLLDPGGDLAANHGGVNVVLVRFEDWAPASLEADVARFADGLRQAAPAGSAPMVVCICPPSPGFDAARHGRLEAQLADQVRGAGGVHLVRPHEIDELYPVAQIHDTTSDKLGHIPYTAAYFTALGTMVARKIHALRTPPFKAIALDCDDTLWRGICGEDGPQGVVVDPPRRALQEFMLAQQAAGMLLCLCSKNNAPDVFDTFRLHPEMLLRLEHFTAWRINWQSKPVNLAALAEELDLGLDSFILVDDNPRECREVEASCPQVLSLALPGDEDIPAFLRHVWAFDRLRVTEEDRARPALYAQERERHHAEKQAASLEDFLRTLQLEVRIASMSPKDLARVAQLTQRTNQMNFTTVRRSETDIQALLGSGKAECLAVHVSDRFGSYGLVGVMIFRTGADTVALDTFLLSCRALGRGVEHRMLAELGRIARERGLGAVEARFVRSQRNQPALLFLESVGLPYQTVRGDALVFRFPAEAAAGLRYEPSATARAAAPDAAKVPAMRRDGIPYARIATELRTVEQMAAACGTEVQRGAQAAPVVEPRSDLERQLCRIWSDMLGVRPIGIHDNFFDLGGHSLLAVQLLSRLKEQLGIELSLEVVYGADFTVAELAKAIELREIEMAGADRYAELLAEVESLSDEEVRELLARESGEAAY
ncbi:MAG TPA: HAD-IIIC family phosphatase [Bryobacteraceae bacterium]|nr:HAD-IIIC family phosphatase [Bryobacteraceae bacterium]